MRRVNRGLVCAVVAAVVACGYPLVASAQIFSGDWDKELKNDHPSAKTPEQQQMESEIIGLQAAVRTAVKNKDKAAAEKLFAPDFTMTHGGGAVQDRQVRLDFITGPGNGGYEAMTPEVQSIRILGHDAAVSIANNSGNLGGKMIWIRYMIVYSRGKPDEGFKGWREAAAHVIMIVPKTPAAAPGAGAAH